MAHIKLYNEEYDKSGKMSLWCSLSGLLLLQVQLYRSEHITAVSLSNSLFLLHIFI